MGSVPLGDSQTVISCLRKHFVDSRANRIANKMARSGAEAGLRMPALSIDGIGWDSLAGLAERLEVSVC
jgi:hypothetical protein